jgi:hypothetical protein
VTGNLEWLDYGARMYDSGLGRWFGVDPFQESFISLSPYNYCSGNPMVYYPKKVYSKVTIIERGEIILKGVEGTFRGKTLKTGLKAEDYLLNKCIYIVYKFSHQRVIVRSNLIMLLV